MACRRRYFNETPDSPTPVVLVDKGVSNIPVTCTSQTATTTFINEQGKETIITTYTEQATGPAPAGDLGIPSVGNGHASPSHTNGLLANGNTDPSELRLLQHEHH